MADREFIWESVEDHTFEEADAPSKEAIDVLFYSRASQDRTGKQSSVTTQKRRFQQELKRHPEWNLLDHFADNDVSASKTKVRRPEFERMMKQIAAGTIKPGLIVAYDISRLLRNRRDKLRLEELLLKDIHFYDLRYKIDTGEKMGRILFAFMAEMAIDRAQELAEYQQDYHDRRRGGGKPSLSARGVGYTQRRNEEGKVTGFDINPQAAKAIRWGVKQVLQGASMRSIRLAWNEPDGPYFHLPRQAEKFSDTSTRNILTSARIAGCVENFEYDENGNVVSVSFVPNTDGSLPAIVSIDDVLAVRERVRINGLLCQNGGGVGRRAKYLLSGIPECGVCGARSHAHSGGRKRKPSYHCQYCARENRAKPNIDMALVDEFVTGATFERVRSGVLVELLRKATASGGVEEIARRIAFEEEELRRFEELVDKGPGISPERFLLYTGVKEARIADLKSQLADALEAVPETIIPTLPDDLAENIERYWDEADLEWKRRLIRLCFERIVINRAVKRGRHTPEQTLQRVVLVPRKGTTSAADLARIPAAPVDESSDDSGSAPEVDEMPSAGESLAA